MRRIMTLVLTVALVPAAFAVSQTVMFDGDGWQVGEGSWSTSRGRLEQTEPRTGRAKANLPATQSGDTEIRFDARYVGGAEDGYAAFGIHVLMDSPNRGRAWGNGDSYLLWLTYDPAAYGGSGAYAQVYRSRSGSDMTRVSHIEIPRSYLAGVTLANVGNITLPVRIRIDTATGRVRVKDPVDPDLWWAFSLGTRNLSGRNIGLRTSSVAASFDNVSITRIR